MQTQTDRRRRKPHRHRSSNSSLDCKQVHWYLSHCIALLHWFAEIFTYEMAIGLFPKCKHYSLMNIRQLHILFNSDKTWHVIVCWFLCFSPNLPELNQKLFWKSEQNNYRLSSGKFGEKHRNQQTFTGQVLAELNKIWSCLIFICCTWFFRWTL